MLSFPNCKINLGLRILRRRKDGSLVPVSLTLSPIRNADGEIVGAAALFLQCLDVVDLARDEIDRG